MIRRINHVAMRSLDSAATIDFYVNVLGLEFAQALQNDYVPSVGRDCPHFHMFFSLPDESAIAFFEAPSLPLPKDDPGTPEWIQHIALDVPDDASLQEGVRRLDAHGIKHTGVIDHGPGHSVYFNDPSGHRVELVHWLDWSPAAMAEWKRKAVPAFEAWEKKRKALAEGVRAKETA